MTTRSPFVRSSCEVDRELSRRPLVKQSRIP